MGGRLPGSMSPGLWKMCAVNGSDQPAFMEGMPADGGSVLCRCDAHGLVEREDEHGAFGQIGGVRLLEDEVGGFESGAYERAYTCAYGASDYRAGGGTSTGAAAVLDGVLLVVGAGDHGAFIARRGT